MKADSFKISLQKILSFPLWVKQVIYAVLKTDLVRVFNDKPIVEDLKNLIQLYRPKITFVGKKELEERIHAHEEIMYTFLKEVSSNKTLIDITLDCFLTLQEVSKLYLYAVKMEYLIPSESNIINATAEFFSGEIKTGEYLMKIGRLTVDQLDIAIRHQSKLEQEGKHIHMAEIITNLGFIEKNEIITVLIMKEEAKKRFIYNMNFNTNEIDDTNILQLQKEVEKLKYENNYLKTKLNAILKVG